MAKRKAFGISKDLNDGISQTINAVKNNAGQLRYEVIPLGRIKFDPDNPRKLAINAQELLEDRLATTDPLFERKKKELESLKSLAISIKKSGVRNAIEIFKDGVDYRLISGERRVLASLLAGKEDIQARVLDIKPSEFDIRYLQWIENIEREDLSIWERIDNVHQLVNTYSLEHCLQVTATVLKDILGCSLPHAMTYLAILEGPADIQELLRNNTITNMEKAAFLAKITDAPLRTRLTKRCIDEHLSLANLKKILQDDTKLKAELNKIQHKNNSRPNKRVLLGSTEHIPVAKVLLESVLAQTQFQSLKFIFKDIDWNDHVSVTKGFQIIIKSIERELNSSSKLMTKV